MFHELNGYNYTLINNHFKTFLITLLSFTLIFLVSCSNEGTTGGGVGVDGGGTGIGGGGVDLGSIPTASGTEATASELSEYNSKTYMGTIGSGVTRKSFNSNPQEFGEQFSLEESGGSAVVNITGDKIYYSGASHDAKVQIYKSADGKSYIASEDTDLDGHRYKSYIQITFNSATEITFYLFMGMSGSGSYYTVEYEGTLKEDTSSSSN